MDINQKLIDVKLTLEELQEIIKDQLTDEHCNKSALQLIEEAIELYKTF